VPRADPKSQAESEGWIDWLSGYISPSENAFEPVVDIYYPIIDDILHVDVAKGNNFTITSNAIVGIIAVSIYWREFIRDILPPGSDGVVVVIQSPCNLPFTYQMYGPNVKYLGVLDLHDSKYDHLLMESKVVDLNSFALRSGVYTGAPINENVCPYTVSIYPSDVMKSDFTTRNRTIALISVLLIFAFTSFVFIIYDCSVECRQDKVMESAVRSSAIVDSLFPSTVRNQLYEAQAEKRNQRKQKGSELGGEALSAIDENSMNSSSMLSQVLSQGSIAQVYPDTTVIFADIVGFTSWSSTREPTQVFQLLETVYAGFDALAKIYGVFKIETIGDSYVAVVGLPKAKKQHAVVMAKFANDCRTKMQELTNELEPFLGPVSIQHCFLVCDPTP
jgi:Adenylate and Guanylate cyclase catalytic domain